MGATLFSHLIEKKKVVMGKEASMFFVKKSNECEFAWLSEKEMVENEGMVVIAIDKENVEMMNGVEYKLSIERM